MSRKTVVDLFAGAGGATQGLLDAGWEILAAVEAYALVKQWVGVRSEADLLTKENRAPRRVVETGVRLLKESGADAEASRLERALFGR